jgi:putative restriction endonuclease
MAQTRTFGEVPGISPGTLYETRMQLFKDGIHRQTQAGISGTPKDGADSIVISGGYTDDIDLGNVIIYTGHGGRDKNGRHVADQELVRGNLALVRSQLEGLPVRLVRGADRGNVFAPDSGYRYDGLFRVESHWQEVGAAGFKVWRFRLVEDATPQVALLAAVEPTQTRPGNERPQRASVTTQRIIRDTALARQVKQSYDHTCQVCGLRITTASGPYAEAAHIRPLGTPHNGPDKVENILCLCPNHHTMFDLGVFSIADDFTLVGLNGQLTVRSTHTIDLGHLAYHRQHFYEGGGSSEDA